MNNQKRKWSTILIMAIMSITLILGATGCADNNDGNVIIEDNKNAPANAPANTDINIDADSNEPEPEPEPETEPETEPDADADADNNTETPAK